MVKAQYFGGHDQGNFVLHMLILSVIRLCMGNIAMAISRLPVIIPGYKVQRKGVSFQQVDREKNWYGLPVRDESLLQH